MYLFTYVRKRVIYFCMNRSTFSTNRFDGILVKYVYQMTMSVCLLGFHAYYDTTVEGNTHHYIAIRTLH